MNIPLFFIPVIVVLLTRTLKVLVGQNRLIDGGAHKHELPWYGGMPSAHAALAFSFATLAALVDGIQSMSFALSCMLVMLITDDALRLRVYIGRYGTALSQFIAKLSKEEQDAFPHLEQRLGHTGLEVAVGAVIGILLTLALYKLFVG